jgi:hypothetical protein
MCAATVRRERSQCVASTRAARISRRLSTRAGSGPAALRPSLPAGIGTTRRPTCHLQPPGSAVLGGAAGELGHSSDLAGGIDAPGRETRAGESWLALSLAQSVAAGGMALGTQPVTQGDVLYLALEENARRLQARARQLLASMTGVPSGMECALDWPRLDEGGLTSLEDYLQAHPNTRLVVTDTWARLAPLAGKRRYSHYEGDDEALMPLKRLADTYHVSILAVQHLCKTTSRDVLDELTGSIGMTGAVDGTLILKRERGQTEGSLLVTGRAIEREQQLALSFDAATTLWSLVGDAEEVGRTRARQEILELLREQGPDGMSAREVAEALEKNYHTTRSLLRKMEGTSEVRRSAGQSTDPCLVSRSFLASSSVRC